MHDCVSVPIDLQDEQVTYAACPKSFGQAHHNNAHLTVTIRSMPRNRPCAVLQLACERKSSDGATVGLHTPVAPSVCKLDALRARHKI
jgi:hypothetical protein